MIYFDTETCGLHGPIVLIQYAKDNGPIHLHNVWMRPIHETFDLIKNLCYNPQGVCGFNLAFDWFHICQLYTTLSLVSKETGLKAIPQEHIELYALKEPEARDGDCLKPCKALDLMLHARKGPYQSLMARDDIRIKRVPTALAWELAKELDVRIKFKDIYFTRKKTQARWTVYDIHDDLGDMNPDFKDIVLKFAPSSALKALAADILGVDTESIRLFSDIDLPKRAMPVEYGYAPMALAVGNADYWNDAWPSKIHMHISHWEYNEKAREYASDDVKYTRLLHHHFRDTDGIESDDDDSVLACMVGAVRWRGFNVDLSRLLQLRQKASGRLHTAPGNFNSTDVCRRYLYQVLDETEKLVLQESTKKVILEDIAKWKEADVCKECHGAGCEKCVEGFVKSDKPHPAATRAQEILEFRRAKKEIELYDKLLLAKRFHASFVVIGTLSSRMAGADGLNPQGINRTTEVRGSFPLASDGDILCGGDFDGFEVTLMDAAYHDPLLHADLLSGKKIHALFGESLFPGKSYDDIVATKGLPGDADLYDRSKRSVFGIAYGGDENTLVTRIGISLDDAREGYHRWCSRYKEWARKRAEIFDQFCSMRQPGGIGTKVEWNEPADYIESLFGFRRYFTLENRVCKTLFNLAEKPPQHWNSIRLKVIRRDREQSVSGAVRSALFACAFAIQAANMRAAANHVIQSSGAEVTKGLQRCIWDVQPPGIHSWRVQPMNIHDEVMAPTKPQYVDDVKTRVVNFVESVRPKVPLIKMEWRTGLKSWADK